MIFKGSFLPKTDYSFDQAFPLIPMIFRENEIGYDIDASIFCCIVSGKGKEFLDRFRLQLLISNPIRQSV
jgi:hypothetical protein